MLLPFLLLGTSPLPGAAASGPDSALGTTPLRSPLPMFSENVGRSNPSRVIRCDQTTPLEQGGDVRCPAPAGEQPGTDHVKPPAPAMTAPDSHIGAPDVSASPFITSYTFYEKTSALGSPLDAQSTSGPVAPPGINVAGVSVASQAAVTIPDVRAYLWHQ